MTAFLDVVRALEDRTIALESCSSAMYSSGFCVNEHWTFPAGCLYVNNAGASPPLGFLAKVSEAITAGPPVAFR
jgi:hypothetical protein